MDVDFILRDRSMWKDDDKRIMNILDNIEVKENIQFPVTCPICGKKEGHLYFHRYENEIAGGMWVWCSACKHSAHSRFSTSLVEKPRRNRFSKISKSSSLS